MTGTFPGTTGSANQIAQFTQNLRINNRSGFFVRVTNTPSTAQAAPGPRTPTRALTCVYGPCSFSRSRSEPVLKAVW